MSKRTLKVELLRQCILGWTEPTIAKVTFGMQSGDVGDALYYTAVDAIGEGKIRSFETVCSRPTFGTALVMSFLEAARRGGAARCEGAAVSWAHPSGEGMLVGAAVPGQTTLVLETLGRPDTLALVQAARETGLNVVGLLVLVNPDEHLESVMDAIGVPTVSVFTAADFEPQDEKPS